MELRKLNKDLSLQQFWKSSVWPHFPFCTAWDLKIANLNTAILPISSHPCLVGLKGWFVNIHVPDSTVTTSSKQNQKYKVRILSTLLKTKQNQPPTPPKKKQQPQSLVTSTFPTESLWEAICQKHKAHPASEEPNCCLYRECFLSLFFSCHKIIFRSKIQ